MDHRVHTGTGIHYAAGGSHRADHSGSLCVDSSDPMRGAEVVLQSDTGCQPVDTNPPVALQRTFKGRQRLDTCAHEKVQAKGNQEI